MDLDAIMSRISGLAQTGVSKAKDLTEIAKLKIDSAAEEDAIRKAYIEIGKLYFSQHAADPDPAFASLCAQITQRKEKIAYNDERITDIKLSGDVSDDDIEAMATQIPLEEEAAEEDPPVSFDDPDEMPFG